MKSCKLILLTCVSFVVNGMSVHAQHLDLGHNVWTEEQTNQVLNIRYGSYSPTYLSSNPQQTSGIAKVDYSLTRGKFHAINESGKVNDLNVLFAGLKNIGNLNLYGFINYQNLQEDNHSWNSTLYLDDTNPYIIGDSINSDATTEAFHMEAMASYNFSERWRAALRLGLKLGSRSDQNDPRPKTTTSVIPITLGSEWSIAKAWNVGVAAGTDLISSNMSYTIVNNLTNYRYFIMRGMGASFNRSSSDVPGYKRDYSGATWRAALHGVWKTSDKIEQFLQLSGEFANQDATDGGSSFRFKGGDYEFNKIGLQYRLQYRPQQTTLHQFWVDASRKQGKGTWFDQERAVDTEHGNRTYYRVLAKTVAYKPQIMMANVTYRMDKTLNDGTNLYATLNTGIEQTINKYFGDNGVNKQEYNMLHVNLNAGKTWNIQDNILSTALGGGLYTPLGDRTFATGCIGGTTNDITGNYVIPLFEYYTAKRWQISAMADFKMPLREQLSLGFFAKGQLNICTDKGEIEDIYNKKNLLNLVFGAYLSF